MHTKYNWKHKKNIKNDNCKICELIRKKNYFNTIVKFILHMVKYKWFKNVTFCIFNDQQNTYVSLIYKLYLIILFCVSFIKDSMIHFQSLKKKLLPFNRWLQKS